MTKNGPEQEFSSPAPPRSCPACGYAPLTAVSNGEQVNFLCTGCCRCWHAEAGAIHRVDPPTCAGCPQRPLCATAALLDRLPMSATARD